MNTFYGLFFFFQLQKRNYLEDQLVEGYSLPQKKKTIEHYKYISEIQDILIPKGENENNIWPTTKQCINQY